MRIREFAFPLQALLAMMVCAGLGWMVYTIAFFDPNPPTAAEVHLLETQDSEMLVLKTAAALTVDAFLFGPTQILMPVTGPSLTPTPTFTSTARAVSTLVSVPTSSATATPIFAQVPTAKRNDRPDRAAATATPPAPTIEPTVEVTEPPTEPPPTDPPPTDPPPTDPPPTDPPPTDPPPTDPPPTDPPPTDPPPTDPPPTDPPATEAPTTEPQP